VSHEPHQDQPEQPHAAPFQTTDIAVAAFLVCRGHQISELDGPPTLTSFVFSAVDPNEVELYRLGEPVSAALMATIIRRLFTLVRRRRDEVAKLVRVGPGLSPAAPVKPTKASALRSASSV